MSLFDDASLAMIPSAYKDGKLYSIRPTDGSGDFTFTRGSNLAATRVDVNGLIDKGRENLLLQSNSFDTTWTKVNTSVTSGQSGVYGSNDAWLLECTTTASSARTTQVITASGVLSLSFYAKSGTTDTFALRSDNSATAAWFNVSSGVVHSTSGSVIDAQIESIENGWYRCNVVFNSCSSIRLYVSDNDGVYSVTSGANIYIQDAQLEQGLVATDYIETTTTTAQAGILEDMPRLDYSGGASCPSLLLEPQRTNMNPNGEYFEGWNRVNSSISVLTPNEYISPEGLQNAYKLEFTGNGGSSQIYQVLSGVGIGTVCTASVFVKYISGSGDDFRITKSFATAGVVCDFTNNGENLSVSEVGSSTSDDVGFEDMGNGWFRIYFTFTSDTTNWEININRASGSGSDVYAIYGYQLETSASYQSSYIPTYGSAVTRSEEDYVDVINFESSNILGSSSPYTLFFDLSAEPTLSIADNNSQFLRLYSSQSLSSSIWTLRKYYNNADDQIRFYSELDATGVYVTSTNKKFAMVVDGTDVRFFSDGAKQYTYGATNNLNGAGSMRLSSGSSNRTSSNFSQLLIFPTALTDSEAIALTQ